MQALTTGGGELDRPRYVKTRPPSKSAAISTDEQQERPTFIGITRPAHPMPAASAPSKRPSTPGQPRHAPPHSFSSSSTSSSSGPEPKQQLVRAKPDGDNSLSAIDADVRLIKAELESLKRRVHTDSHPPQDVRPPARREGSFYVDQRRPDTAYGGYRRPDTAYGSHRGPDPRYGYSGRHDVYDDDADSVTTSVDEHWDAAPRDWVERTRRRREMEEEVTYRRGNGHTETFRRHTRNGRPMERVSSLERPRVTFRADAGRPHEEEEERMMMQRGHRDVRPRVPPPALKAPPDDPDMPEGYRKVPDEDRRQMLSLLMRAEEEIRGRYTRLPVILDTQRAREKRKDLEEALDELQSAIAVYAQKKVYIKE